MTELAERVAALIELVPREPGTVLPPGASELALLTAESRVGLVFPQELREWLQLSNGPCIGPGGMFGIGQGRPFLRIETYLDLIPSWKEKGWIPIAGDGVGNYFVMDTRAGSIESGPIYFLDHEADLDQPSYIVASALWKFLWFLFQREWDEDRGLKSYWPFNSEEVIGHDPDIVAYRGRVALPWEL